VIEVAVLPVAPTSLVGLATIDPSTGHFLDTDRAARAVIGMPDHLLGLAHRRPIQRMLDAEGRPYTPGSIIRALKEGVPHSTIRAFRWERGGAWYWAHAEYLLSEKVLQVTLRSIEVKLRRQIGWTCSRCDSPTTAVADHHGRDLCLPCWGETIPCP